MSLEEAQLILNVKRDEPMDIIQRVCLFVRSYRHPFQGGLAAIDVS